MNTKRKPNHPGMILQELYLKPRGITISAFAEAMECTRKHISNVIHGKARIEADLATRIATVLGTTPQLWLNLQNTVDLFEAAQHRKRWKPTRVFYSETPIA